VPSLEVSEHPPSVISTGQAYVTTLINSLMRSPCWDSTAIFLSWDDWGGYYDHVLPPDIDQNGYGLRVPGLVISPYAKAGYIDHQQLSHDAYLKFIEDDFLGGARLDPATDGRPDPRPDVREEAPGLGSIASDFDFEQSPRAPLLLSPHPSPGAASAPPGGQQPPALEGLPATSLTAGSEQLHATVDPDGGEVTDCHFEYGLSTAYGSSVPCGGSVGSGTSPVAVAAKAPALSSFTTYHFRVVASNSGGTADGPDLTFSTGAAPPTVQTGAASEVGQTSATLSASVDPNGGNVSSCRFEYGTSTEYGSEAPCASLPGEGSEPVPVAAAVSGLAPATTYHFRAAAGNEAGEGAGEDAEFRTLPEAPTVVSVKPDAGLTTGGAEVTISGTGFAEASAVSFGSHPASSYAVQSPTSITAIAPAGSGAVDVLVTNPGGTSTATPADRFTYVPHEAAPVVSSVEPSSGPATGGTSVTISGKRLLGTTAVMFGSTPAASYKVLSATTVEAVTPAEPAGTVDVTVTTPNGMSATAKKDRFTFVSGAEGAGLEQADVLAAGLSEALG